ncbi:hypothetical protein POM88_006611 [Heracleum sosnowskyi]|uniref:Uncharacterized protein n=1 Tax=Heracleum sosnowskyi TaxID=360622 RepID=A0AAD8J560_9APIA|nr:hypothetical protein POM88_006611 [Heracleum sosnowskyi]
MWNNNCASLCIAISGVATALEVRASGVQYAFSLCIAISGEMKLLLENAELAEKLNAERDRPGTMAELSSADCSGPVASTVKPAHNDEQSSVISDSTNQTAERVLSVPAAEYLAPKPDSVAGTLAKLAGEVVNNASSECEPLLKEKTTPVENGEIPEEENEVSGTNLLLEDSSSDETTLVPISDAPLIGAPFRFISFMARYVSGADLVN